MNNTRTIFLFFLSLVWLLPAQAQSSGNILMFVSHEETYYSEYIVMYEALQAAGYSIDVRSASTDSASTYMIPNGTDIEATANTLPGSSYADFQQQFQDIFGVPWNASVNQTPNFLPVDGRIQDVNDMSGYDGLVVVGGTGSVAYRVDGTYNSQGTGPRMIPASEVQAAAEKLNDLALDALANEKPVMAQCHGASLAAFWRIPGTTGPGPEDLGYSLLKDHQATGFPEPSTGPTLAGLNISFKADDKVTISSPHSSFPDNGNGEYRIATTRDWYPQTITHAARSLLNMIETYPPSYHSQNNFSVLVIHGGLVDSTNCSASNQSNDIPCNYGTGSNLPADYNHLHDLLEANSPHDDYDLNVLELDLSQPVLPFSPTDDSAMYAYFRGADVIVWFKHWSTVITDEMQNAILWAAEDGVGVLSLHHGLYNHNSGGQTKDILIQNLFEAESAMGTWSGGLANYDLFMSDYGHFVTTYGVDLPDAVQAPGAWFSNPLPAGTNNSYSYYQHFPIYDELYYNMAFLPSATFGRGVNEITPILSNDQTPAGQCHVSGFLKRFDQQNDGTVSRVAFFQTGERQESLKINHAFGQIVRNAVVWLASENVPTGLEDPQVQRPLQIAPNPGSGQYRLYLPETSISDMAVVEVYDLNGRKVLTESLPITGRTVELKLDGHEMGYYLVRVNFDNRTYFGKLIQR